MHNSHGSLSSPRHSTLLSKERAGILREPRVRDPSHPCLQSQSSQNRTSPLPPFILHQGKMPDSYFQMPLPETVQMSLSSSYHYPLPASLVSASRADNTSASRDGVPYSRRPGRVSDEHLRQLRFPNSRTPLFSHLYTSGWQDDRSTIREHQLPRVRSPSP